MSNRQEEYQTEQKYDIPTRRISNRAEVRQTDKRYKKIGYQLKVGQLQRRRKAQGERLSLGG